MRKTLAPLIAAGLFALAAPALGQGFDAHTFHPVPTQRHGYGTVASGRVPGHLEWEAGAILSYAKDSVVHRGTVDDTIVQRPVSSLLTLDLIGDIGLADRLDIGFDVPFHLVSNGDDAREGTTFVDPDGGAGIGDIRLIPRVRMYSSAEGDDPGIHLSGQLAVVLPTGDRDAFRGGGFQLEPRLIFEYVATSRLGLAVNAGYLTRDQAYFGDSALEVDDAITWGVGIRGRVHDMVAIVGDVHGEVGYASATGGTESHPIEGLLGAEIAVSDALITVGFGRGLSHGFGAPAFRFYVGATYGSQTDPDRDMDGLLNRDDQCPDAAEDIDGFEDEDGCPDPDDDGDGVLDRSDRCDDEPEDMDGFEDADGCPDPDNDGDGVADVDDSCPDEAEDIDLFEDGDGCPEEDNDGDTILDGDDRCPESAEDEDGFEDADGCPDPDNDEDGVLDEDDACPEEAEIINGVEDDDGCAEPGAIVLDLRRLEVRLRSEFPWFLGITDDPSPEAVTTLAELGHALNAYPELGLRVIVRSADRSQLEARLGISVRRADAIRSAVLGAGVSPDRVEVAPFAEPLDGTASGYTVELRLLR